MSLGSYLDSRSIRHEDGPRRGWPPAPTGPMARALGSVRPSHGLRWLAPLGRPPSTRPLNCGVIGWQSLPCSGAPNHWIALFQHHTRQPTGDDAQRVQPSVVDWVPRSLSCPCAWEKRTRWFLFQLACMEWTYGGCQERAFFVQRNKTAEPGARGEQGTAVLISSLPGATMEGFLLLRKITPYPFLQIH